MFSFTFKGINSKSMGITVGKRPPLSSPQDTYIMTSVDGRDSVVHEDIGKIQYEIPIAIHIEDKSKIDDIQKWLTGSGKFTRSDVEGRYQDVSVLKGISFTYIADNLYSADIVLTTDRPFYLEDFDYKYIIEPPSTGIRVENRGTVLSRPIIKIVKETSPSVTIQYALNIIRYTFPIGETEVIIDTETREAKSNGRDREVMLEIVRDYGLYLVPGETEVTTSSGEVTISRVSKWI